MPPVSWPRSAWRTRSRSWNRSGFCKRRICRPRGEEDKIVITIEAGERRYELVEGWGKLPEDWKWGQVAGVACDSHDRVHVYTRTEHPYMVFDKSGELLEHQDNLDMAHSLFIDGDDSVFFVSHHAHTVMKMSNDGKHLLTLGTRNEPSDT